MESGITRSFHIPLNCSIYFVTGPNFQIALLDENPVHQFSLILHVIKVHRFRGEERL
jgi:hypothetical protein